MSSFQFGFAEVLVSLIAALLGMSFPLLMLFLLSAIYKRLKSIDNRLKNSFSAPPTDFPTDARPPESS